MMDKFKDVLAYLFIVGSIVLAMSIVSCQPLKVLKQTQNNSTNVIKTTDSARIRDSHKLEEYNYQGIKESFTVKTDSTGKVPEYHRAFNTGALQGEIGYSKERGSYYDIKSKDLKEVLLESRKDSIGFKESNTKEFTVFDSVAETVLRTKKWGQFQWVTFIISLLTLIYLGAKAYALFAPSSLGKKAIQLIRKFFK